MIGGHIVGEVRTDGGLTLGVPLAIIRVAIPTVPITVLIATITAHIAIILALTVTTDQTVTTTIATISHHKARVIPMLARTRIIQTIVTQIMLTLINSKQLRPVLIIQP